jgi:hypothetical protein
VGSREIFQSEKGFQGLKSLKSTDLLHWAGSGSVCNKVVVISLLLGEIPFCYTVCRDSHTISAHVTFPCKWNSKRTCSHGELAVKCMYGILFTQWWRSQLRAEPRGRHVDCRRSAGRLAGVLRNYFVPILLHSRLPLRGVVQRLWTWVTSLAAYCLLNLSWPSGTNWLDPVCARIHQGC